MKRELAAALFMLAACGSVSETIGYFARDAAADAEQDAAPTPVDAGLPTVAEDAGPRVIAPPTCVRCPAPPRAQ